MALIPKASHLVERVAERLLRSGTLDDSAARLLRPASGEAPADTATSDPAMQGQDAIAPALAVPPDQRSSLFVSPPVPLPSDAPRESRQDDDRPPRNDGAVPEAAAPASPAILDQPLGSGLPVGQAAAGNRPGNFLSPLSPPGRRPESANPATGMLQGSASVDAVALTRAGMVDWSRTRSRISEEFRLVQRQIIRSAFGPGAEPGFSNLLLVTSARAGEGKSFISANLAGSVARQGDNHVLLIDADSKRSSICDSFGLAQAPGLLDLAANPKLDPAPMIVKTPIDRLSILPVGRDRERSAELFSTKAMTRLIQSLGRRYADRLLILDAPPCLSASDPAILAPVVGQILFVVEADRTQREEVEASLDLIQACPTITMVLNKQQVSSRDTFGAHSSYYAS